MCNLTFVSSDMSSRWKLASIQLSLKHLETPSGQGIVIRSMTLLLIFESNMIWSLWFISKKEQSIVWTNPFYITSLLASLHHSTYYVLHIVAVERTKSSVTVDVSKKWCSLELLDNRGIFSLLFMYSKSTRVKKNQMNLYMFFFH